MKRSAEQEQAVRPPTPRRLGQSPALDGLRGMAILAVLGNHLVFLDPKNQRWFLRGGFLGVDVFLVLSGFLICATLLAEFDRSGTINLPSFVQRRGRRLVPPLLVFFAIHALAVAAIGDSLAEEARQAAWSLTFASNWQLTFGHHPPFDLVHLWSLAFEGQLYLVCGLAMYAARRLLNRLPVVVTTLCVATLAVAIWRLIELRSNANLEALYVRTDVRADSIMVGAIGAFLWRAAVVPSRVAVKAGVLGAVAILLAWWFVEPLNHAMFAGGFTLIGVAAVAVVFAAIDSQPNVVARVAMWSPLRTLGRMSYSVYLWHLPVYIWTIRALPDASPMLRIPLALSATLLIATASHRFIESRYHAWKARTQQPSVAAATQVSP